MAEAELDGAEVVVACGGDGTLSEVAAALYAARVHDAPAPLAALTVQYLDFAAWERGRLRGEAFDAALSAWTHALDGAPAPQWRQPHRRG